MVQQACIPYACGPTACLTACSTIDDCDISALCAAGQCQPDVTPPTIVFSLPAYTNQPVSLTAQVTDQGLVTSVSLLVNEQYVT